MERAVYAVLAMHKRASSRVLLPTPFDISDATQLHLLRVRVFNGSLFLWVILPVTSFMFTSDIKHFCSIGKVDLWGDTFQSLAFCVLLKIRKNLRVLTFGGVACAEMWRSNRPGVSF